MAERKIGDRTFKTEPLLAKDAMRLLTRLVRVGGAAWDHFKDTVGSDLTSSKLGGSRSSDAGDTRAKFLIALGQMMVDIARNNDTEEVVSLIDEIVSNAMVRRPSGSYDPVEIDVDFQGRLPELYQVAVFVLAENFSDFFGGSGPIGGRNKKAA